MSRNVVLLIAFALALSFPVSAAAQYEPQLNEEAALFNAEGSGPDPCMAGGLHIDLLDFVTPLRPDQMLYEVWIQNYCTGQVRKLSSVPTTPDGWQAIGESDFVYVAHDRGDLVGTLPAFDSETQSETSIVFDLHWLVTAERAMPLSA